MIVGISGKAGSGKSTLAEMLQPDARVSFAAPLKRMVSTLLECMGYDSVEAIALTNSQGGKATEVPLLGRTVRYMLQTLGTEWGRELIDGQMWVKIAIQRAKNLPGLVVIDDVRFDNEAQAIKDAGGIVVHVSRPGEISADDHASEDPISINLVDIVAYNVGPVTGMAKYVDQIKEMRRALT